MKVGGNADIAFYPQYQGALLLKSRKSTKIAGVQNNHLPKAPSWQPSLVSLDGGNSALVINRVLVETNFEASKTLYLKACQSLKNCLNYSTITKTRFALSGFFFELTSGNDKRQNLLRLF